jgi:hypothetical protein
VSAPHNVTAVKLEHAKRGGELTLDGGFPGTADGHAFCDSCGCALDIGMLTDYGCGSELDHFEQHGVPDLSRPSECYWLWLLFASVCWSEGELVDRLYRLAFAVAWESIHGRGAWARDREKWAWALTFRQTEAPATAGGEQE